MNYAATFDSYDESTLKNEIKLIDDSYYRVYDDDDYEIWKERMISLVNSQVKASQKTDSTIPETTVLNPPTETVHDINPVKPILLTLPNDLIYKDLSPSSSIENYRENNVSWGLKYLLAEIDSNPTHSVKDKARARTMLMESRSGRSKWTNSSRIGQDELYQGLEKVIIDLKAYTPYSIPFLVKVSKKDVPDYYNVIKRPMDLGTIGKKLKLQEYLSKQQFIDDLNLIFSNCFTYNTAEDSIYRQHVQMLRDKWTYLLKSVPDIVIGKGQVGMGESMGGFIVSSSSNKTKIKDTKLTALSNNNSNTTSTTASSKNTISSSTKASQKNAPKVSQSQQTDTDMMEIDDLDSLLNTHLDGLSDIESIPSPKKTKTTIGTEAEFTYSPQVVDASKNLLPARNPKLMFKYVMNCKSMLNRDKQRGNISNNNNNNHNTHNNVEFLFPEFLYFFNTIPDTRLIRNNNNVIKSTSSSSSMSVSDVNYSPYSVKSSMNSIYENFRILQSIRQIRKHLLECSRSDPPEFEQQLSIPVNPFNDEEVDNVTTFPQIKLILKKIITLFLAQYGYEMISTAALHTLFELVDSYVKNLLLNMKLLFENYSKEKEKEMDKNLIIRQSLLQCNVKNLNDLDATCDEYRLAKDKLWALLQNLDSRAQEFKASILREEEEEEAGEYETTTQHSTNRTQNDSTSDTDNDNENGDEEVDEDDLIDDTSTVNGDGDIRSPQDSSNNADSRVGGEVRVIDEYEDNSPSEEDEIIEDDEEDDDDDEEEEEG